MAKKEIVEKERKLKLVSEIVSYRLVPMKILVYLKRGLIERTGADIMVNWRWKEEFLFHYQTVDLEEILEDLRNTNKVDE